MSAATNDRGGGLTGGLTIPQFVLILMALLILTTGLLFPFPVEGRLWGEIFNLGHGPAFTGIFWLVASVFGGRRVPDDSSCRTDGSGLATRQLLVLFLLLGTLGVSGEVLQQFSGRQGSISDVAANTTGLLAGLLWTAASRRTRHTRNLLRAASGMMLLLGVLDPVLEIHDCIRHLRGTPMISSLEFPRELASWETRQSVLSRSSDWATNGRYSLKVQLSPSTFSGASLSWMPFDWNSYHSLRFDVQNAGQDDILLHVKIHDTLHSASGFSPSDRFETQFLIPAKTATSETISIDEIVRSPANRLMQQNHISRIEFFCVDTQSSFVLYLDHLRLE
jgi:hypothetical protein